MTGSYDVIVAGLGAWGSATTCELARRGRKVVAIDRFHPPHKLGSSHGNSRGIGLLTHGDATYTPLLRRSYELWNSLMQDSGNPELLSITGSLLIGRRDGSMVKEAIEGYERDRVPYRHLEKTEVLQIMPALRLEPNEVGLYEQTGGVLRPEECIQAHLELAARSGAELRPNEQLRSWESQQGSVTVETSSGYYTADRLILTLGAWMIDLMDLQIPLVVERQVMLWFQPTDGGSDWRPSHPKFYFDFDSHLGLYGMPGLSGEGTKIAFHHGGLQGHPDSLSRVVDGSDVEQVRFQLKQRVPILDGYPLRGQTCLYTNSSDRHFIIGVHPQHLEVLVAGGDSGLGFKFSPVIGEILADLIYDGKSRYDISLFNPNRFHENVARE